MARQLPELEELRNLAERDPEGLERLRAELVENLIAQVRNETKRRRLRGLQFRINLETERCKTPLSACLRLSEMMHESLLLLRESFRAPLEMQQLRNHNRQSQPPGRIMAFKPKP